MVKVVKALLTALIGTAVLVGSLLYLNAQFDIPEAVKNEGIRAIEEPNFLRQFVATRDFPRMKETGFNTVVVTVPNPLVSGKPRVIPLAQSAAAFIVKKAHLNGLSVMLVPEVTYEKAEPSLFSSDVFKDELVDVARVWAEFAERYNVEYFVPLKNPPTMLGQKKAAVFAAEVLPEVRERYKGKVIADCGNGLLLESTEGVTPLFSACMSTNDRPANVYVAVPDIRAYDYVMFTFVPPAEVRNFDLYATDARRAISALKKAALRRGSGSVLVRGLTAPVSPTTFFGETYGPVVTEGQQAELVSRMLEAVSDLNVGFVLCGWGDASFGLKGRPAEAAARKVLSPAPKAGNR
jgi:hypothetical protein